MGEAEAKIRGEECEVRDRQAPGGKDNDLLQRRHPQEWPARVPSIQKGTLNSKERFRKRKKKDRKKRATGNKTWAFPRQKGETRMLS